MRNLGLTLVAGLALAGCEQTPLVGPQEASVTLASVADPAGIAALARGAAHRDADARPVMLNFHATLYEDGTARGQYYFRAVASGVWIQVGVTCMSTQDDNKAWIGGIIESSSIPSLVGTVSYFYTFDNGEGDDGTDIVSLTRAADQAGEDLLFCDEQPEQLPSREVLHGNVNVDVF
jgi:hypothetical protein